MLTDDEANRTMQEKAAERERRRQAWQRHLDIDKANMNMARLREIQLHMEEKKISFANPIKAAHYRLAYYLRTGKKFLDLQEARFLHISPRQVLLIIKTPQQRCRQCWKNRKRLTPLTKGVRSKK